MDNFNKNSHLSITHYLQTVTKNHIKDFQLILIRRLHIIRNLIIIYYRSRQIRKSVSEFFNF